MRPRWPIFAADPAGIAHLVHEIEKICVIYFAAIRLVSARHAGDLHVSDAVEVFLERRREVAFDDLRVVEVHLDLEAGLADFFPNRVRLGLCVEEEAGNVARVDGLDEQRAAVLRDLLRRRPKVADVGLAVPAPIRAGGEDTGHGVEVRSAEAVRVLERAVDACQELGLTPGNRRAAALACRPVSRRQVEQHVLQIVVGEPPCNVLGREVVREQELDGVESCARGGLEPLEETAPR